MKLIKWSLTHSHVTSPLQKQAQGGDYRGESEAEGMNDRGDTGAPWAE